MASSSGSAKKRKRVVLPLERKIAILERLKAGATQAQLAAEYGIGKRVHSKVEPRHAGKWTCSV